MRLAHSDHLIGLFAAIPMRPLFPKDNSLDRKVAFWIGAIIGIFVLLVVLATKYA